MHRAVAKKLHEIANLTGWMENPAWRSGNAAFDTVCRGMRALPFSVHQAQKRAIFNISELIAVSSESVVVVGANDTVDKVMLRYPRRMCLQDFEANVRHEVGVVTECLGGIALATRVSAKNVRIFRNPKASVRAVVQTQPRLDLTEHLPLDVEVLQSESNSPERDQTARDLEAFLLGTEKMVIKYEYRPDVAPESGNLRRSVTDGRATLIDVMPIYGSGYRLIGDSPPALLPRTDAAIAQIGEFVGQFGA